MHPAFFYFLKKGEKIIQLEMRVYIFLFTNVNM